MGSILITGCEAGEGGKSAADLRGALKQTKKKDSFMEELKSGGKKSEEEAPAE